MKKVLILLLSLLLLAGCGKTGPAQEAPATAAPAVSEAKATEAPAAEPTPAPTAEPTSSPAEKAAKLVGDAQALLEAGETRDNLEEALFYFQIAVLMDTGSENALLGLADCYIRLGDPETALAALKEYGGADPSEAVAAKIAELEAGNVIDAKGRYHRRVGRDADGNITFIHVYDYNDRGELSRITHQDPDGAERSHIDIVSDEQGREIVTYGYSLSQGDLYRYEITYDQHGLISEQKGFLAESGKEFIRYVFTYDEMGREIRRDNYPHGQNVIESSQVNVYDEQGRKIRNDYLNGSGALDYSEVFSYNEADQICRIDYLNQDGKLTDYRIWTYGEDGRLLSDIAYNPDGSVKHSTTND